MGKRLGAEAHRDLREKAYSASLQGVGITAIAKNLQISERTVHRLLKEARDNQRRLRSQTSETQDLETFLAEQDQIMAVAWTKLRSLQDKQMNVANLLAIIGTASERKARATGSLNNTLRLTGADGKSNATIEVDWTRKLQEALSDYHPQQASISENRQEALPVPMEELESIDAEYSVIEPDKEGKPPVKEFQLPENEIVVE